MKFFYLLLLLLISLPKAESREKNTTQHYLGIKSGIISEKWQEAPAGFSAKDLAPSKLAFFYGSSTQKKRIELIHQESLSVFDKYSFILDALFDLSYDFQSDKKINSFLGIELKIPFFTEDSIYNNSQMDHAQGGLHFGLDYRNELFKFYFDFHLRKVFTETLAELEGLKTEISHEFDNIYRFGILAKAGQVKLLAEYSLYDFGISTILSKEFFLQLPSQKINKILLGFGLIEKKYDLWIKFQQFSQSEDRLALLFQAPHFTPDYILAKQSYFLELKWKF